MAAQDKRKIAVFDIDGTLADIAHRIEKLHHESPPHWDPSFDWKGFFHQFEADRPIDWTVNLVRSLKRDSGMHIMIFTGRSEVVRTETECWLQQADIPYDTLIMRASDDYRLDEELKPDLLRPFQDQVAFIVEDRNKITWSLRKEGYNVLQCAHCEY